VLSSASLAGMYAVQELLEGIFAAGHPSGLAALFAHGGWWALAAAAALGGVVAALLRLASVVVGAVRRLAAPPRRRQTVLVPARPRTAVLAPRGVLATAAAGRAPPLT
jgi:hypothetical protein